MPTAKEQQYKLSHLKTRENDKKQTQLVSYLFSVYYSYLCGTTIPTAINHNISK